MRSLSASLVAALVALLLASSSERAHAQTESAASTVFRIGTATITIRAHASGRIHIDAEQRGRTVSAWFEPGHVGAWAEQATLLLDPLTARELGRYVDRKRGRVEYKTPLLFGDNVTGIILDRIERGGEPVFGLFVCNREGTHRLYLPMTHAAAAQLVETLSGAAVLAQRLAGDAVASR